MNDVTWRSFKIAEADVGWEAASYNVKWEDGKEYPLIKLEISNTSHPFFTGKNMLVDTAGRIDKFKKKYAKKAE